MRGEQTGVGVEQPGDDRATYSYVLVLISAYIALILVTVFVMDWFIVGGYGYGIGRHSIDLWAATTCDPSIGCVSAPLEKLGYSDFRPFAIATLWTTALSAVFVLARCGAFLLGLRIWRGVAFWAYGTIALGVAAVFALMLDGRPEPTYSPLVMTPAPFMLLAAHVLGLCAVAAAALRGGRVRPDRAPRIPGARVVRG